MVTPLSFLLLLPQYSLGVCEWFPVPVQGKELVLVGLGVGDTLTALWLGWLVRQALASSLAVAELRKRL